MKLRSKKSYRFAFLTAIVSSLILSLVGASYLYLTNNLHLPIIVIYGLVSFVIVFAIIQIRIEKVIYSRIQNLRDNILLLESSTISQEAVTTDMSALTRQLEEYAFNKKVELETLKDRDKYRREFVGNVSHELKTPLFTIQGYLETLIDGAIDDDKLRMKYLERAVNGVERLTYIVQDLDSISKFELGQISIHRSDFDIIDLISGVFDLLEIRASQKSIVLSFDIDYYHPIMVNADREKIQQVLTNLIENAIKYGHKDGTIEVGVELLTQNKYIVRITDNGEGIEKENLSRIFERFYRVDKSGNRNEGGSGLGLSIVKHIIEGHQEKIFVESIKDIGSEFSFTLQRSKEVATNGEQKQA